MTLVLASASPRRQELLRNAGIEFVVRPANIQEIRHPSETPKAFAERMAREKARVVWNEVSHARSLQHAHPLQKTQKGGATVTSGRRSESSAIMLGADTVVVVDNELLGKPSARGDAARMLRLLSGREHSVITGVCLLGDGFEDVRSETTAVHFSELTEPEIRTYVDSGEPMDKAGAYAIQGMASKWISKMEGDYNNVVGLPVDLLLRMLREHGAAG
jgi:septum formation protein